MKHRRHDAFLRSLMHLGIRKVISVHCAKRRRRRVELRVLQKSMILGLEVIVHRSGKWTKNENDTDRNVEGNTDGNNNNNNTTTQQQQQQQQASKKVQQLCSTPTSSGRWYMENYGQLYIIIPEILSKYTFCELSIVLFHFRNWAMLLCTCRLQILKAPFL